MSIKPGIVPINSQWLSGEGAGSLFYIEVSEKNYKMTRFSQEGKVECSGQFKITNQTNFDVSSEFKFTYLSHCKELP